MSNSSANTQQERTEGKATAASKLLRTILEKSLTRSFSYAAAILALVSVISITEALSSYRTAEIAHERSARALAFASELRARSDRELNAALYLASGIVGYLAVRHDKIDSQEINDILAAVYSRARHIRNFAVAVGTRISYIYPRAGNESVIDKDYRDLKTQWPAVKLSIDTNQVVLTGSVSLVQGGVGLIYRTPVFVQGVYWGMLSTVIDIPGLQRAAFAELDKERFDFAIRVDENAGSGGGLLWGLPEVFSAPDAVLLEAAMPNGKWVYAVRARDPSSSLLGWAVRGASWTLAALIAFCVHIVLRQRIELAHLAGYDSLTELPNRRLFDDRLDQAIRHQKRHGDYQVSAIFVDLNNFKPINDTFGHKVGDRVLRRIAQRLRDEVRSGDTVSRWAGDEFVLIIEEANPEAIALLIERLRHRVAEPFEFDGIRLVASAAIGSAFYPAEATDSAELLKLADQRMYDDKKKQKRNANEG